MDYFKVVYKHTSDEDYVSISVYGPAEVIYKVGEWVRAPEWLASFGYHLLVFNNYEQAKRFASFYENVYIFRCEVRNIVPLANCLIPAVVSSGLSEFKMGLANYSEHHGWWPADTVMAEEVKLVELLWSF